MNYVSIFLISFFIAFSGALTPGPLLTAVIHESTKRGAKAGPLIILGHILIEITMLTCIIFGLVQFLRNSLLISLLTLTGSGIMIFMGLSMLKKISRFTLKTETSQKKSVNLIMLGFTMSIANPYWSIWWLTIGLGLVISAQQIGIFAISAFFLGHILADFLWYAFVSVLISRNKRFISQRIYKLISSICALALIGFGIFFAINNHFTAAIIP
ncbi:MAG: LysE family transporter [Candidatus Omnitrophota bacterium]